MPSSLRSQTRPPRQDQLPPGPLAQTRLDPELLRRGLALPSELAPQPDDDDCGYWDERPRVLTLAEKLKRLFDSELPRVHSLRVQPAWVAGELLRFGGDFDKYVRSRDLIKQEGIIFRHLLRFILLCGEFVQLQELGEPDTSWLDELRQIADQVTTSCRAVDPQSTDKIIESARRAADVVTGETQAEDLLEAPDEDLAEAAELEEFGAGVWDEQ
ncbi:MAG TPA: hypothetical protein EYP14_15610 [Planctomycetaceae bacterium]|nr:hypothetical protein [Planctomycetaceae bacterium]